MTSKEHSKLALDEIRYKQEREEIIRELEAIEKELVGNL